MEPDEGPPEGERGEDCGADAEIAALLSSLADGRPAGAGAEEDDAPAPRRRNAAGRFAARSGGMSDDAHRAGAGIVGRGGAAAASPNGGGAPGEPAAPHDGESVPDGGPVANAQYWHIAVR
jgi:hypothetical protein